LIPVTGVDEGSHAASAVSCTIGALFDLPRGLWLLPRREAETDDGEEKVIVMMRHVLALAGMVVVSVGACGGEESQDAGPAATGDSPEVTVLEDTAYATWKAHTLTLDVFDPATADSTIVVHLESSNAGTPEFYPRELAAQGATVFVVDYPRMGVGTALADGGAGLRAMADSAECALHFARDYAAESGEEGPVALTGYSLGGGLAAHAALFGADLEGSWDEHERARGGPPGEVDCVVAEGSTEVDVLVGFGAPYDGFVPIFDSKWGRTYQLERDPDLWEFLSSPVGMGDELTVRLVHGVADTVVPYEVSTLSETALADAGYDVQLVSFPSGHEVPEGLAAATVMDAIHGQNSAAPAHQAP
jgi:hypothetical protein